MGTPQNNAEGYARNRWTDQMDRLGGHLLLIHCNMDPVVLWQNSLTALKRATEAGRQVDYAVYVGHGHNVRGRERVHLMEKIRAYFGQWL